MASEVSVRIVGMRCRNDIGHSATLPFLLGFVIGMVIPIVSIVMFRKLGEEVVFRCGANTIEIHNSAIVFWMYLISTLSVVIAYVTYCYFRIRENEADSGVVKSELEFANNAVREICRNDKELCVGVPDKEKCFTVRIDGSGVRSSAPCTVTMTRSSLPPNKDLSLSSDMGLSGK